MRLTTISLLMLALAWFTFPSGPASAAEFSNADFRGGYGFSARPMMPP